MDNNFRSIFLRFPQYTRMIVLKAGENEDFANLCSDYELCIEMIAVLETEPDMNRYKLEEYIELKQELEHEVLKFLY